MVHDVVGDSDSERLAIITGGPEMNAGENTSALYLLQGCCEIRKLPRHPGHRIRPHGDGSTVAEVTRQDSAGRTTDARMARWIFGKSRSYEERQPVWVPHGGSVAIGSTQWYRCDGPPK